MDRRERYLNEEETLRMAVEAAQSRLWTALPGFVIQYPGNAGGMTVDVQPAYIGQLVNKDGTISPLPMKPLLDCPILWQGGGGVTATFPIKAGDECLVLFSSRCIDGWWQLGGAQDASNDRMHDLSDGFALIGVRSLPRAFALDSDSACLISDDGETYFKLNPTTQQVAALAPGGINLNGLTIDSSGNLVTAGDVTSKGKVLATHIHSDPQGGDVSPPL